MSGRLVMQGGEALKGGKWSSKPFGQLVENFDSIRVPVKQADRKPGLYPYYGASGVVDHVDSYIFDGEYLLVAEDGENLKTRQMPIAFLATGKFWVNNHAHIVRANTNNDTRFLMYAMRAADINSYLTGSTMPKLTQANMNRVPVVTPQLSEQRAIARILGALDDKIELNRKMNATLEAMARALFKSWFVDFDPVREKSQGRAPSGMDAETAALFPSELVESELGLIPRGWTPGRLDDLASIVMGLSPSGNSYNSDGVGTPLINGPVEFGEYFALKAKWTTEPSRLSEVDDLIFCVRGSTTGRRVVADGRYALGRGVCAIRPDRVPASFLYEVVEQELPGLLAKTTGSVFPSLNAPDIKAFGVVRPTVSVINAFDMRAGNLLHRRQQNHREAQTLARIRDKLLPRLLSGELSVAQAEREAEDVA